MQEKSCTRYILHRRYPQYCTFALYHVFHGRDTTFVVCRADARDKVHYMSTIRLRVCTSKYGNLREKAPSKAESRRSRPTTVIVLSSRSRTLLAVSPEGVHPGKLGAARRAFLCRNPEVHRRHVARKVVEVGDRLRACFIGARHPLADESAAAIADEVFVVMLPQVLPDSRHAKRELVCSKAAARFARIVAWRHRHIRCPGLRCGHCVGAVGYSLCPW